MQGVVRLSAMAAIRGVALVACLVCVACSDGARDDAIRETVLVAPTTVLAASETSDIGLVVDMFVDPSGNVILLDWSEKTVVAVSAGGETRSIGRQGEGPGEFQYPSHAGTAPGALQVLDQMSGKVQVIDYDGRLQRDFVLAAGVSEADFGSSRIAFTRATRSPEEPLVSITDTGGELLHRVVAPVTAALGNWDTAEMRRAVANGEIPVEFHNDVLPVLRDDNGLWVFLQSQRRLQSYSDSGAQLLDIAVDVPESAAIRQGWEEVALDGSRNVVVWLRFVGDAAAVGPELWLLWADAGTGTRTITIHGASGVQRLRVELRDAPDAGLMSIDTSAQRLYVWTSEGALLAYDLTGTNLEL